MPRKKPINTANLVTVADFARLRKTYNHYVHYSIQHGVIKPTFIGMGDKYMFIDYELYKDVRLETCKYKRSEQPANGVT